MDNAPLAERVRTAILDAILAKQYVHKLPSEDVLADILKVSRTTIRTALSSLEQEGVITRRRAVGTTINGHVRPSALALQRLVGFDRLVAEQGYAVRVQTEWSRTRLPDDFATGFGAASMSGEVLLTHKRYFADGHLAIYIRDAVPWSELKDPDALPRVISPSVFEFSREHCRRAVDHAVVEIVATVMRQGVTQLEVPEGEAFTRLLERHYATTGDQLAASIIDVDDTYVRFEVVRRQ